MRYYKGRGKGYKTLEIDCNIYSKVIKYIYNSGAKSQLQNGADIMSESLRLFLSIVTVTTRRNDSLIMSVAIFEGCDLFAPESVKCNKEKEWVYNECS